MYLLIANFQNYGHEETTFYDKAKALEAFEKVKTHGGAFDATLYKLKTKKSWSRR